MPPNDQRPAPGPGVGGTVTTVTVGAVDDVVIDTLAAIETSANSDFNMFTDYMVYNEYENDGHTYMTGVTSPTGFQGASVAFCQLASPTLLWICRWTACKTNEQPEIPSTVVGDPNWVLLDVLPTAAMEGLMPDGITPLYRISGVYVYGHKNPAAGQGLSQGGFNGNAAFKNVQFPRAPWIRDDFNRTVPPAKLQGNISDIQGNKPAPGPGGGLQGFVTR